MSRFSLRNWLIALTAICGTRMSPLMLWAICRRSITLRCSATKRCSVKPALRITCSKLLAVEFAVGSVEGRVVLDAAGDRRIAQAQPHVLGLLVERGLGDHLAEDLAVETECARLVGRDRLAELARDPLDAVVVVFTELLDRDLGRADGGDSIAPIAAENVADAPDREADHQEAHDDAQDDLADPGRGGFVDTAEHGRASSVLGVTGRVSG